MRKPLILGVILVGVVIALVVWLRRPAAPTGPAPVDGPVGAAAKAVPAATQELPARKVRRLGAEERKQLGAQIASARKHYQEQASKHAGGVPALVDDTIRIEQVSATVKAALEEAIPLLAECYGAQSAGATATVMMTMVSDPELGTVIGDAVSLDRDGAPLRSALDSCLRDTIESLALPPLEVGGKLPLQYSFVFD
jgi:hypothetical protein